jgi:hypothetical protein
MNADQIQDHTFKINDHLEGTASQERTMKDGNNIL